MRLKNTKFVIRIFKASHIWLNTIKHHIKKMGSLYIVCIHIHQAIYSSPRVSITPLSLILFDDLY